MKIVPISLVCSVIFVGVLSACSSGPSIKETTIRSGKTEGVVVTEIKSIRRNNLLTAQVSIKNEGDSQRIAYRFKWLTKDGMLISREESWKPILIGRDEVKDLVGIAPLGEITDFKFELTSY